VSNRRRADSADSAESFTQEIGAQAVRKIKAQRVAASSVWSGFATFGMIGWAVSTPALLGALLGLWLDHSHPGIHSWTLALLIAGLCLGCASAWRWVAAQQRQIRTSHGEGE
jgi:ATP synthase protein I